jgi:hypothetical protein
MYAIRPLFGTLGRTAGKSWWCYELKISRFTDPKPDRGFKTIYAGSQAPQFSAFFGFDFAGGASAILTSRSLRFAT